MADEKNRLLFNFDSPAIEKTWVTVNDNVMGGVSDGNFKITKEKALFFYGNLSLENNGGFASVRSIPTKLALKKNDSISFQAKGDGREYTINLYTNKRLTAFSYRQAFQTKKGEWLDLSFPLSKFVATSFGRNIPNSPPVNSEEIESIGFMLGDKKSGTFEITFKNLTIRQGSE